MPVGIKISKPGKDVKTCPVTDLILISELVTLKIAKSDHPTAYGQYTHNIGYAPAFFCSAKLFKGSAYKWGFVGQEQSNAFELTFASDSTNFYYAGECRYFLFFQDTI